MPSAYGQWILSRSSFWGCSLSGFLLCCTLLAVVLGGCGSLPPEKETPSLVMEVTATDRVQPVPALWFENARAACSLTFDDGTLDQFLIAFPELRNRGLPATFFVITDCVDNGVWLDGDTPYRLFSWDHARIIAAAGCEVASHSAAHVDLAAHPEKALKEMSESYFDLQREIPDQQVFSFGWPYWRTSAEALGVARYIYHAARSGGISDDPGSRHFGGVLGKSPADIYSVGARGILSGDTREELCAVLEAVYGQRGWLVPNFHGISAPGTEGEILGWEAIPVERFRNILDELESRNFWFATFGNVARYVSQRDAIHFNKIESESGKVLRYRYGSDLDPWFYDCFITIEINPGTGTGIKNISTPDYGELSFKRNPRGQGYQFNLPPGSGILEILLD